MYRHIRELREEKGLTQKQMGELLSCSQRIYSNYERGEVNIPIDVLIELARFYHVNLEYLLDLTERREPIE